MDQSEFNAQSAKKNRKDSQRKSPLRSLRTTLRPSRFGIVLSVFLLLTTNVTAQKPSVETVQFQSKLTNATLPYNVILPPDYRASRATRYPVLYLLHGFGGHYSDWVTRTNVADYAAQYRMIVVMPEGNNGWYTDSASVATGKYESYILKELIPDVQKRYRTIDARYGRAVAGLSMGGYGALKFGLKSPETFVFVGSLSGALAAAAWTEDDLKNLKSIIDSLVAAFGPVGSETRKANDIYEITRGLSAARVAALPYIYLDCGTEDFLVSLNQQFAALLREKKIPHEYRELPGDHNWAYWDQQVPEVLKIAAQKMRLPRAVTRQPQRRQAKRT
jgi:S-formylglutathione hydrolase FrmB